MDRGERDSLLDDQVVSPFLQSLDSKIASTEVNESMTDIYMASESFHIMDRVPGVLREQNENAYSPATISIGPLHRGTERLQPMEPVKLSYMRNLFKRTATFEETRRVCAAAMLEAEEVVRKCYEPARLPPNTEENVSWLAEVMLVDGCFIIELMYRYLNNDYDPNLWNPFKYYALHYDLLLLENQIPFFVLQALFKLTVKKINSQYELATWVFVFFGNIMGLEKYEIRNMDEYNQRPYHILHFLHIHCLPPTTVHANNLKFENDEIEEMENIIKYSATELRLGGVELKAGKERNLFDIKFTTAFSWNSCSSLFAKGHLEIPTFSISESTESFLRNFIAFELSCPFIPSYFTSLAFLMDILIDTPKDVKLLEEAGIICSDLGSREEVARIFNGICKNTVTLGFLYRKQYKEAMNFCKPWRVSTGKLRQYYFGNSWSGISVIAAIIIFSLAFFAHPIHHAFLLLTSLECL